MPELIIDPEFHDLIPPLTAEEFAQLEANVRAEGVRESLIGWEETGILLDGHNRKKIADENGILLTTKILWLTFRTRNDALVWVIRNQFGRRNLTAMQRAELALKLKPLIAGKAKERMLSGKSDPVQNSGQGMDGRTERTLADVAGVSHDTIAKVEKIIASPVKELTRMTRAGEVTVNIAASIAKLPVGEQESLVSEGVQAVKDRATLIRHEKAKAKSGKEAGGEDTTTTKNKWGTYTIGAAKMRDLDAAIAAMEAHLAKPKHEVSFTSLKATCEKLREAFSAIQAKNKEGAVDV